MVQMEKRNMKFTLLTIRGWEYITINGRMEDLCPHIPLQRV